MIRFLKKMGGLFLFLLLAWPAIALGQKALFDNFSSDHLDGHKWWPRQYVNQIADGQYIAKLGNSSGMGAEKSPGIFRINLPFTNPDDVIAIQTKITIVEAIPDMQASNSKSFGGIGGYFYNTNQTESLIGDIWASVRIGNRGDGLEAFWEVSKRLAEDSSEWEGLGSGTIALDSPLQAGVPVSVKLDYDENQTITFSVNGKSAVFVGIDKRKQNAQESFKGLSVGINAQDGSDSGFISAEFDNVFINNIQTAYDDFSLSQIDPLKWKSGEWVRKVSDGSLESILKRSDSNGQVNTYLSNEDTPYFEAKVRIDSETELSDGASGIARLQGYFYNDSRGPGSGIDYNGYEGDIFVQVRLSLDSEGALAAKVFVDRSDMADESIYTGLFAHTFSTPIFLDTDYVLFIYLNDNTLSFGCNTETIAYDITTPVYAPYGEHRGLRSRLYLDTGETGYLKTQFDNIFIENEELPDRLTRTKISQLYVSIFGRASEGEGNAYWCSTQSDMTIAANAMLGSPAAIAYFGASLDTDQAFVKHIYNNTLGKTLAEDPDGIAYWVGRLTAGDTRGRFVSEMAYALANENFTGDAEALAAQGRFNNRVMVSNYTANTILTCPDVNNLSVFMDLISGVTDDPVTLDAAKAAVDTF